MKLHGIIPALITPLTAEGKLDKVQLEKLMKGLMAQGATGFYIGGATGEGVILDADVHKELTRESVRIADHKVPVIVHVARMVNSEMIELAKYAEECGADAISAIPPLFYKYGDDGIYEYYKRVADAVSIPVVIYNNPNTGVTFTQGLLDRLFTIKNITAIKWTNYDFSAVMQLKSRHPDVTVINGPDEMCLLGLTAGCDAAIGTTYNFQLPLVKKVYDDFCAGKIADARAAQTKMCNIIQVMIPYGVIMATRLVLEKQGYDVRRPHFPMQDFTPAQEEKLLADLRKVGLEI